jgi:mannose-1-phosphate guanylyltransferase
VKAVVLVGGEGTRLRPLTETTPKPLLPLVDRAILDHVLDHLVANGIREVIMSSPYLEDRFDPFIAGRHGEPAITWITEREPLGTGGAIVGALDRLGDEAFVALNGDILTDLALDEMVSEHRDRGAAATIALHPVEDVRAFGVVVRDGDGRVAAFREKPEEGGSGEINAGTYVLEPAALRPWSGAGAASIERDIFPRLIADGAPVHGFPADAYWTDLGTPERYLEAHLDLLRGAVLGASYEAPWLGDRVAVGADARVGRWSVLGASASVGAGASVDDSVLFPGALAGEDARVERSILGHGAVVEDGASAVGCVLGDGARVPAGLALEGWRGPAGAVAGPS